MKILISTDTVGGVLTYTAAPGEYNILDLKVVNGRFQFSEAAVPSLRERLPARVDGGPLG